MKDTEIGLDVQEHFPELSLLVLSEQTISGLPDVLVDLAMSRIHGITGASVSRLVRIEPYLETVNASSELIQEVDNSQYQYRSGPSLDAIRAGNEISATLPSTDWVAFSERAINLGIESVWSLPLAVGDATVGALTLYSTARASWSEATAAATRSLARQAAVVMLNATAFMNARLDNQQLLRAIETRDVIGQAKGVLMARESVSSDQAFDILRRASQRENRKLREIAAEIVARASAVEAHI